LKHSLWTRIGPECKRTCSLRRCTCVNILAQINAFLALTIIGMLFALAQFLLSLLGAIATGEIYCPSTDTARYVYCREVSHGQLHSSCEDLHGVS